MLIETRWMGRVGMEGKVRVRVRFEVRVKVRVQVRVQVRVAVFVLWIGYGDGMVRKAQIKLRKYLAVERKHLGRISRIKRITFRGRGRGRHLDGSRR